MICPNSVCLGSLLLMRSFAIKEAPSPFPALYATLALIMNADVLRLLCLMKTLSLQRSGLFWTSAGSKYVIFSLQTSFKVTTLESRRFHTTSVTSQGLLLLGGD